MSDAVINGLAGTGGGIIAQLITYPLQTVNTRQQTERDLKKEKRKLGTVDQMFQVIKKEGWERLYGGLAPSLVGTAASQGVYYYFYQIFRNKAEVAALQRSKLGIGDGSVSMLSSLVVAALSGCVNVLLTNPIWVVTRMQTHRKIGKKSHPDQIPSTDIEAGIVSAAEPPPFGTANAVQDIYGEGGFLGFWRGVFPTLIMVSNPSMQFMLYETMLKKLKKRRALSEKTNNGVTAVEIFLLGALAKLGATVVTYPLLVVKVKGLRELENPDRFEQRRQTPVVTEAMGEKKNPKKANLNDHHAIKLVLDESVTEMITSRGYAEDVRMSNLRLALWFLVIVVALFAQFYDKKFPANRDFLILCITLYVALNVVLLMIVYLKEKSAILFVYPPKDSVTSTGLAVSSKFPRYSDLCTLVIASADPKSISANRPVKLTKTVTKWFTKDGSLVEGLFCKDVEALIYQYETRRKKSK